MQGKKSAKLCGKLVGPVDGSLYAHENCALWSPEVFESETNALVGVKRALKRAQRLCCGICKRVGGASVGCHVKECKRTFHYACAAKSGIVPENTEDSSYELYCFQHIATKSSTTEVKTAKSKPKVKDTAPKKGGATQVQTAKPAATPHSARLGSSGKRKASALSDGDDAVSSPLAATLVSPRTAVASNGWSEKEMKALRKAHAAVEPTALHFWEEVAASVPNRTSLECAQQFHATTLSPAAGARVTKRTAPEPTAVVGVDGLSKAGTGKRKREIRLLSQLANKSHEDDVFDSTPLKGIARNMPLGIDESDLPSARKLTPSGRLRASSKHTDSDSPDILKPVNRADFDGYINRVQRSRPRDPRATSPAHKKPSHSAPKTKGVATLAKKAFAASPGRSRRRRDDESADDEEEGDYYWSEGED